MSRIVYGMKKRGEVGDVNEDPDEEGSSNGRLEGRSSRVNKFRLEMVWRS